VRYSISPSPLMWLDACTAPGSQLLLASVDDCSTDPVALPFTFTFYGVPYTTFEPNPDGYISFIGMRQCYYGIPMLPSATVAHPAAFIYGRDLFQRATGVCLATFGSAPNRQFVVETNDAYHFADTSTHLTFEVVLSESTNTLDFLYQTLSGPGTTGEMATVGLEDASGTVATVYESSTPGTLRPGLGLRFTPF
jgi:hypothetical protein